MIKITCDKCKREIGPEEGIGEFSIYMLPKTIEGRQRELKHTDYRSFRVNLELCEECTISFTKNVKEFLKAWQETSAVEIDKQVVTK